MAAHFPANVTFIPSAAPSNAEFISKFALGGIAAMTAACFTNPIDVMKVRLQSQGEGVKGGVDSRKYKGFVRGAMTVVREEGIQGLYKGLPPALVRESTYSTIRFGAYEPLRALFSGGKQGSDVELWRKILAGGSAGIVGSVVANPADLVKIRMQADAKSGAERRYTGTIGAFASVWREGGIAGLFKGVVPNAARAGLATCAQLPTYDHTKHTILKNGWMKEGFPLHVVCSMFTGIVVTIVTSPADVVKTRVMNSTGNYTGVVDCVMKTLKNEGPLAFYKGAFPNYLRLGPHTLITFVVLEQLRALAGIKPV
eukprot:CAMPEP_0113873264 /NCGR_PEP_ID=MMETSP0780_2-20120614/3672_1 /TAXON_ID=652834 /ORGANISM="Palpitomonas bilix" /LENGTH=311 /DNA_ID=CAMNT_0000858887 /DNA_START=12 /DNA_END=947 /DNA_ORIENTATION=- /assembly_acc=CAM_ASM_000599